MKTDINEIEIKKFYEGISSGDEERRLRGFGDSMLDALIEAGEGGICDIDADSLPEMPAEYSVRIEAALAKEMQREKTFGKIGGKGLLFRRAMLAAGVAATLLLMLLCGKLLVVYDMSVSGEEIQQQSRAKEAGSYIIAGNSDIGSAGNSDAESAAKSVAKETAEVQSIVVKMENSKRVAARVADCSSKRASKSVSNSALKSEGSNMAEDAVAEDDFYLSPEEENELRADNYRVIENEEEANAIINAIFARIEANMMEEESRLTELADKFQIRRVIYKGN